MIRALGSITISLSLSGCVLPNSGSPQLTIVTVDRPIAVSCVPNDSPPPPIYRDSPSALKAARDFADRDGLVKGEYAKKMDRLAYLERLREDCIKAGGAVK